MLTPRVRLVNSRIRSLNRKIAFGAIRRFGSFAAVKLNPRNFRSHGYILEGAHRYVALHELGAKSFPHRSFWNGTQYLLT